jgi:caffeoyl-CoA O-methyltransferase
MSRGSFFLSDQLGDYVFAHNEPEDDVLAALAAETAQMPEAMMQSGREVGLLLQMLTRLGNATNAIEVGTFTGYSSLCIARSLAPGGRLTCFDVSETFTDVARRYWKEAGVDDRVELRIGPAIDGLRALPTDPVIDIAYIDADKTGYPDYFREIVPRLRPGGVLVADNTLQNGQIIDPSITDASVEAIRRFNDLVVADDRVHVAYLTISDGVTICQRR